jgi:proteic killer suppression protein
MSHLVIRSFSCKETERVWQGQSSRKFPGEIQVRALRKLRQLDAAVTIEDLRNPPGNRPELLKGKRAGQMSIRINDQWRICFRWAVRDAADVEIVDYH